MAKKRRKMNSGGKAYFVEPSAAMVKVLDELLLKAATSPLDDSQKAEVLSWAHRHLMAPVIRKDHDNLDPVANARNDWEPGIKFSLGCIDIIGFLLNQELGLDENLIIQCLIPESQGSVYVGAKINENHVSIPGTDDMSQPLLEWFHRRLSHSAQRTRLHSEDELKKLISWSDIRFIICSLFRFEIGQYLRIPLPDGLQCNLETHILTMAANENLSIDWRPGGPVYKALKPPPRSAHLF